MSQGWTRIACQSCNGTGWNLERPEEDCGVCMGRGSLDVPAPERNEETVALSVPIARPEVDEPPAVARFVYDGDDLAGHAGA